MAKKRKVGPPKAEVLIGRFPVTDLANAVSLDPVRRERFLRGFIGGAPQGSYEPLRKHIRRIYGAQPPLIALKKETWAQIEHSLITGTSPGLLEQNLGLAKCFFDFVREQNYDATEHSTQYLRYGRGQIASPIGIDCYLTQGDRLLFQFPQLRRQAPTSNQLVVMASIIHQTYAVGDFEDAQVEILDFSTARGVAGSDRVPTAILVDRAEMIDRDQLNEQIDEVYAVLQILAAEPIPPGAEEGDASEDRLI